MCCQHLVGGHKGRGVREGGMKFDHSGALGSKHEPDRAVVCRKHLVQQMCLVSRDSGCFISGGVMKEGLQGWCARLVGCEQG
jgi:hypothetical protein